MAHVNLERFIEVLNQETDYAYKLHKEAVSDPKRTAYMTAYIVLKSVTEALRMSLEQPKNDLTDNQG